MLLRTEEINYLNELELIVSKYKVLREKPHLTNLEYFLNGIDYHIELIRKENK